ncbi:2,3-bisphosphoglycerate-independent phosphoglycerate mutase [Pseudaestuariivita sp.]|uniref:2,3-bisphosphoglycerate-independent phosphoglycerate mutase n=1 Tax=Pseudaestuariivita sp. TaxID=2211669 RepID=UPI004059BE00
MTAVKPVVLCILDGWGLSDRAEANAPMLADTPHFDRLMATCPNATLVTHGPDAGLPSGQMGNSEVGHTNIGAGRVVAMDLGQIDLAIEDGSFFEAPALMQFAETLAGTGGTAHLMGVASDGGVHGHLAHILAAAEMLTGRGIPVVVHAITDGRDVAPKSADGFMAELLGQLPDGATVGTVSGRFYALDRDNRWERVETAYRAMVQGEGPQAKAPGDVIDAAYADGTTDEFIPASVIEGYGGMAPGDGLFCLNFRADRAREILAAICDPHFSGFDRGPLPQLAARLGMVTFSDQHAEWLGAVFPKRQIANTLGAWVAKHRLRQFRLAETEKYPHVTFFLNGGVETPEPGEDRHMPPSPKVATYDLQPEMSADEVTDAFVDAVREGYDLIVTNYANPDMVGHTGDLEAAKAACAAVDRGLGRVLDALEAAGGAMVLTADHGNCEVMVDPETGAPHTAHTLNPVPVLLVGGPEGATLRSGGRLADLAPTVLALMGLAQPDEMTGESLIA